MTTRLAIVSSHPIQYNAPAFRALAANPDLDVHVFYGWEGPGSSIDPEFGRAVEWDIPLLDGYSYTFVPNAARDPGSHRFRGIDGPALVGKLRDWNPDVLLVYGWAFASHLRALRVYHGRIPVLFRGDSTLLDERPAWRTVARSVLLRWVYSHVDVALYAGKRNHAYFRAHGVRDHRLVWAPHAVDNEWFADGAESRESQAREWRRRLGIASGETVFLLPAKLIPLKDPFTLLKAFMELRESAPEPGAHLVFAGDGELMKDLRAASASRADVHFLGFQNQSAMPVVYRIADVVVLASLTETWGLGINEGMACGRPAIVSDRVGCAPDLIVPHRTGLVFEHGNVRSIRDAMAEMVADKQQTAQMGRNAAALIERWSIPAYASVVSRVAGNAALIGRT